MTKLSRLNTFTILLHFSSDDPGESSWIVAYGLDYDHFNFMVGQYWGQLVFEMRTGLNRVNTRIRVPKPFEQSREVRLAVVYDGKRLSAYIGGQRKADTGLSGFDNSSWTAESPLVLGSGTNGKFPWSGTLYSLAILNHAVPETALRNHDSLLAILSPAVRYSFDRRGENTVIDHGTGDPATLTIPMRFEPYTRSVLLAPKVYWLPFPLYIDFIGNVLVFVPIGFLLMVMLSRHFRNPIGAIVAAVFMAFVLSLGIELLQSFLPSRWSTLMDLLANTLGAGVGVLLSHRGWVQKTLTLMNIGFRNQPTRN